MSPSEAGRATGPWQGRVRFGPGGFAYRPGEVLVRTEVADFAEDRLRFWAEARAEDIGTLIEIDRDEGFGFESFARFTGSFEVGETIAELNRQGVAAQVNHVLFATACCPPHPSRPEAEEFYANPFYANPFYANPFYANPFYANPFYANAACGCGCRGGGGCGCGGASMANPFYANPFYANGGHSGSRPSSARPAEAPVRAQATGLTGVRVAVLDTGWAQANAPSGLPGISIAAFGGDEPDEDADGFLDPAAGHGTFIAGVIEQAAPGCDIEVIEVLSTYGDGDEVEIAATLAALAQRGEDERPHIVNLSFGGYSPTGMTVLAQAISALADAGVIVVASAGNDASCLPLFPAAFPGVIGVGAIDDSGRPAPFTNFGPWVRACAPGVDIVSLFFEGFNGAGPPERNYDPDRFSGWARWSGTSFAAPRVAAELARAMAEGATPQAAVAGLIDDQKLPRRPMLGTVVGWTPPAGQTGATH